MREIISVTGMVIRASAFGESDKRLVLLTRERGKITVFSRGCKRPGNVLMAASRPFVFGTFFLVEGRDAYNLQRAEVKNYFVTDLIFWKWPIITAVKIWTGQNF